jgi:hypothetical protein
MCSCILTVGDYGDYWWFEFVDKSKFVEFKNPAWAKHAAESIVKGAFVTTGRRADGSWAIQSVQIPKSGYTAAKARELAIRILAMIQKRNISEACNAELKRT